MADANGRYRVSGMQPGTVWVHAEAVDSLLAADADTVVPALPANATLDVLLPASGRIAGTVRFADGTAAASVYLTLTSSAGPLDRVVYVQAGADGRYAFEGVPLGAFTVQSCDYAAGTVCAGAAGVLAAAGSTATVDVTFAARSAVEVIASAGPAGQDPLPNVPVVVYAGQMGPGDMPHTFGYTDTLGAVRFDSVQRGPIVAAFTDYGTASALDVALLGAAPLTMPIVAQPATTPNFSTSLVEVSGATTMVDCSARLRDNTEGGTGGPPYAEALRLRVQGNGIDCLTVRGDTQAGSVRRLAYGPWSTGGVLVSRHVTHDAASSAVAYLERLQNTTGSSLTVDVDIAGRFQDPLVVLTAPGSVGNRYAVVTAADRSIFGHVFAGTGAGVTTPALVRLQAPGGDSTVRFRVTIPPNDYRVIAHFAFTRPAGAGAAAQADAAAAAIAAGADASVRTPLQVDWTKVVNFRWEP
jgi:hypothetical protein